MKIVKYDHPNIQPNKNYSSIYDMLFYVVKKNECLNLIFDRDIEEKLKELKLLKFENKK